jgi:glycosyltransferase involved in cell wall biosynthesis
MKTVHVAPMHRRDDTRVFWKESVSLAASSHDVTLIVADGKGDDFTQGVRIVDVGSGTGGRVSRRLVPLMRASAAARRVSPDVIHFHDAFFLPFAIACSLTGWRVIYDVHEDYPRQVMTWRFSQPVRRMASLAYRLLEAIGGWSFKRFVAATPAISRRFPKNRTIVVRNYPRLDEFSVADISAMDQRPRSFCYVGGLSAARGARTIVEAIESFSGARPRLLLAGRFDPLSLENELRAMDGWSSVDFRGWVDREQIKQILSEARAGLLLLHPKPNHLEALPIKLFEYMASGLPVIASDFPLWREIVTDAGCGLLVDPTNPTAIADAMRWILDNPGEAEQMGKRGRHAVLTRYNWDKEAGKLLDLYGELGDAL